MCGINGIFVHQPAGGRVDRDEMLRSRDYMTARGPDAQGEWLASDERIGFGHRRLSIIDLSNAGSQPMSSVDGSLVVTFNGEIYNYRELRSDLIARGHVFRSHSDTEVLLHLYAEKGGAMVRDLRGMFAFAIWDGRKRELFLARDPYGIKPLYYADDGNTFRFASQVKALLAGGAVSRQLDPAGLIGFHVFGSVPEPLTHIRAISALPAGHTMVVTGAGLQNPVRYHDIATVYRDNEAHAKAPLRGAERLERARSALLDSVRHHLVADVPVGAFLSSGIDSTALVGLMRDAGQSEIETVTLSFEEFAGTANDEAPLAAEVAKRFGTRHTTRVVTKAEFEADLPHFLEAMDQPSIDAINTWFVSKAAKERGLKVVISGVGGDELFGGYPSFSDIPRWVKWLAAPARVPGLGQLARRLMMLVGPERLGLSPKSAGMLEYGGTLPGAWLLRRGLFMPWELPDLMDPAVLRDGLERIEPLAIVRRALTAPLKSSFDSVATLESALYMRNQLLRDSDWASMAHSLELRTPLVDSVLLEEIAALGAPPVDSGAKQDLALAPQTPLPAEIVTRKKTGFFVPVTHWTGVSPRDWALSIVRDQQKQASAAVSALTSAPVSSPVLGS